MSIDIANESGVGVDEIALAAIARYVLDELGIHPLAELSVLLVDEKAMTELHERWMGEPGPTDVLAFPMDELRPPHLGGVNVGRAGAEEPAPDPGLLGDVVLCPQVAAVQARGAGHSTQDELELLAVHCRLHVLGDHHAEPQERADMFGLQDRLLASWRSGRAERAGEPGPGPVDAAGPAEGPDEGTAEGTADDVPAQSPGGQGLGGQEGSGLCPPRAGLSPPRSCSSSWPVGGPAPKPPWSGCRPSARSSSLGRPGRRSKRLQAVFADLPRYLNILLLLRVTCETAATVLVGGRVGFAVHWFGATWKAFLIALAVMVFVGYLVVGMSPALRSCRGAERVPALGAATVLYPIGVLLGPIPRLLVAAANVLTRGKGSAGGPLAGQSELRGLVDFLEQRSVIEPGEREMVRSVFELGDTIVREATVPRTEMVFVERDKTVGQALSLHLRSGFSRIPVAGENEDDVVGIAYLKDIVAWSHEHPGSESVTMVDQVMRPATYVPDSKPIDEMLRQMQALQIHVAIVIDEYGGTAGLVTIEDILDKIVGEIADEYDQEQPPVEWLSPDVARVTARLPVTELGELFGVTIEAEDVETVGGLLAHALGRVPIAGSEGTVGGLRLTAENLSGRRNQIGSVLVERLPQEAEQEQEAERFSSELAAARR